MIVRVREVLRSDLLLPITRYPRLSPVDYSVAMDGFRITYTVEAAEAVDRLQPERREILGRGLRILAQDPYHKATAPIGTHEDNRKAQVAPGILIEYVVAHGVMVVVILTVFDDSLYLLTDDELGNGTKG